MRLRGVPRFECQTGRNTRRLRKLISDTLDWEQMAKTSRPELFQHIRDDIEARRRKKQIVLTLDAFKRAIQRSFRLGTEPK